MRYFSYFLCALSVVFFLSLGQKAQALNISEADYQAAVQKMQNKDASIRWKGAKWMSQHPTRKAIPVLMQGLEDSDKNVRNRSAKALARMQTTDVTDKFLILLKTDKEWAVRREVAASLQYAPSTKKVIQSLIASLKTEKQKNVRYSVVWSLGALKSLEAMPYLKALTKDPDVEMRRSTLRALAKIGNADAINTIGSSLMRGRDYKTRMTAAESLGDISSSSVIPLLEQALSDADYRVGIEAAKNLYKKGASKKSELALVKILPNSKHNERKAVISLLGRYGTKKIALPVLKTALAQDKADIYLKRSVDMITRRN